MAQPQVSTQDDTSTGDKTQNQAITRYKRPQRRSARTNVTLDDFENSACARCITAIVCRIPCVIVCCLVFGDSYLLLGYSRLVLIEEIGTILTVLLLLFYTICALLLLTSYFRCMFTSCAVKDNPPPKDFDETNCPKCEKCGNWKPRRAHHCSLCGTCTLKMDHHCPWVGNCVGLHNYKYFLIFLFWVSITAGTYGILTGIAMIKSYKSFGSMIGAWTVLSLFITSSFALSVGGFFFFHVHLLRENKTTLENMKYKNSSPYATKSGKESFNDIFGDVWYLYFMPVNDLKETGYEMYDPENDGVSASLIHNGFNNYDDEDEDEDTDEITQTVPHRQTNIIEQDDLDPKVLVKTHKIDIGTV